MFNLFILRFKNYYKKIIQLDSLTKFNLINFYKQTNIKKIILNISFKLINFNKKKILSFLILLEILTGQKYKLSSSKKSSIFLKTRKGSLVGCSVQLQNKNLYKFYDYLLLAFSRSENFLGINKILFNIDKTNTISITLDDLFNFYQLENDINALMKTLKLTFLYNTKAIEEKIFLCSSFKIIVF